MQTVFWNVPWRYSEFMDLYADVMIARCKGHIFKSYELGDHPSFDPLPDKIGYTG